MMMPVGIPVFWAMVVVATLVAIAVAANSQVRKGDSSRASRVCRGCGADNPAFALFCRRCGQKL